MFRSLCSSFSLSNKTNHIASVLSYSKRDLNICIVGSGPAGFYTAKQLLQKESNVDKVDVTILEKLPTPYGLVRYGVAPDHPEVKNVQNDFDSIASDSRVKFLGNVTLGKDVRFKELSEMFDVVVLTYGADSERSLGINGESLKGVESAREFVSWYNGLPSHTTPETFNRYRQLIETSKKAVIIGQGNVALDVARILARPIDTLKCYDLTSQAINILENSNKTLEHILVVGRRGPVQIAATTKELRELTKLNCLYIDPTQVKNEYIDENSKEQLEKEGRAKQRLVQLLQTATEKPTLDKDTKLVQLLFFRNPVEFIPSKSDPSRVGSIKFEITLIEKDPKGGEPKAVGSGIFEEIECDLVFESIGYKSVQADTDIPFDQKRGVVLNEFGRVINENSQVVKGAYVCGWLKRGPSGVILSNIYDAEETVGSILSDYSESKISSSTVDSYSKLIAHLQSKSTQYITFEQYKKLERHETEEGVKTGKIREKVLSVEEMLNVCFN